MGIIEDLFGGPTKKAGDVAKVASEAVGGQSDLTQSKIQEFLESGYKKGEEFTGITGEEVGKKRGEIRGRYEDILEGPSRGAARVASARGADIKRLRAGQQKGGVKGGMAKLQETQMTQDYAGKIGDVRQKEYLDALNKIEKQYRGAGADIMGVAGQEAAIKTGMQPAPTLAGGGGMFDTYLCTELYQRGLISKTKLLFIHILLIIGTFLKPAQTAFYLTYGRRLVHEMNKKDEGNLWGTVYTNLFKRCFKLMLKGNLVGAVSHYEIYTENLFKAYGFHNQLEQFNSKWSFEELKKSLKFMWRVA